jgi:hypothetical protein
MAPSLARLPTVRLDPRRADPDLAAAAPAIPVLLGEFSLASRSFPILFAVDGDVVEPVVLTSLGDHNAFLRRDGSWDPDVYLPAYVRRHPFGLVARDAARPEDLALVIDAHLEGVNADAVLRRALAFREAFHRDAVDTREFCLALRERGLLVPRKVRRARDSVHDPNYNCLYVVDLVAFVALDNDDVLEWNSRGWLAGVYLHLISLRRIHDLLRRANRS